MLSPVGEPGCSARLGSPGPAAPGPARLRPGRDSLSCALREGTGETPTQSPACFSPQSRPWPPLFPLFFPLFPFPGFFFFFSFSFSLFLCLFPSLCFFSFSFLLSFPSKFFTSNFLSSTSSFPSSFCYYSYFPPSPSYFLLRFPFLFFFSIYFTFSFSLYFFFSFPPFFSFSFSSFSLPAVSTHTRLHPPGPGRSLSRRYKAAAQPRAHVSLSLC